MTPTPSHLAALNRPRRIVVQYDAHGQLGAPFAEWLDFRFHYVDIPGSQIDSIIWDIGAGSWATYPSEVLPRFEHPGLKLWWDQGIEWVGELVRATHERGLECFWNHRVSEVDINPLPGLDRETELMMDHVNPVKAAHPDWVIKTWWWQGLWDYAVPEVREYNLAILRELAGQYDLDGFQLDFARHIPCLPVGRQWELREGVTEFLRMVRGMLQETAQRRGKPYLLAARIPNTLEGCRADGFDVWAWTQEGLVDILTLGSRSMQVDIEGFREAVAGPPSASTTLGVHPQLVPCFDDHHATDGYRYQPIEFLRGVFANWWQQGADSVATFNWGNAPAEVAARTLTRWERATYNEAPDSHGQAYLEVGDPVTMAGKDKVFAVERRGGYPWAEGYFNRNDEAPLPVALRHDGTAAVIAIRITDDLRGGNGNGVLTPTPLPRRCAPPERGTADGRRLEAGAPPATARLRAVLFGAREGDEIAAALNGVPLERAVQDFGWKDPQVFSPNPQPASGGSGRYEINPDQKLLRLEFGVPAGAWRQGRNEVSLNVASRIAYCCEEIMLEKLEVHLRYGEG
jgi:hypothetical protein